LAKELLDKLFSMDGKVAFITGGYSGIGLTFAETYAAAGAAVTLADLVDCSVVAENIAHSHGVRATGKNLDVRDAKAVDRVVAETIEEFGRIDVLVNCAGIVGAEKPLLQLTDEEFDKVMNINFRGTMLVARSVARQMVKQQSGKIINIASIMAAIAARNIVGYCVAKAAVVQLTRVMALELMRDNVQVNVLCPGYFSTNLNAEFFASEAGQKFISKMIPIKRVGQLCELQSAALFLATGPAFLTGTELYIDGGHTIV
jgi:NAD(P)-dependent dehydrogenase (short-subunit alcohol dehydrogenase family)